MNARSNTFSSAKSFWLSIASTAQNLDSVVLRQDAFWDQFMLARDVNRVDSSTNTALSFLDGTPP